MNEQAQQTGTVTIFYGFGSGSNFLTSYGTGFGSVSRPQKVGS